MKHGGVSHFGKLFPTLEARPDVEPSPLELGGSGGPMDAKAVHSNNPNIPAAFTYLGQFLDHDITFDPFSSLQKQNDPAKTQNFRTPAFELDSLYGMGPAITPYLYDSKQSGKMLLGPDPDNGKTFDLPRNSQGVALIGDPRNDENMIVGQLHVAFLKFHNAIVDQAAGINDGVNDDSPFEKARRLTRWHYQWIVLHDFLPTIVGQAVIDDILNNGRKFFHIDDSDALPVIPIEFSVAAYRFGHTQVQPGYKINDSFGAVLFNPFVSNGQRGDLRGGPVKEDQTVNWRNFIDTGVPFEGTPPATRQGSRIDTKISGPLMNLPSTVVPSSESRRSLAVLNLTRGLRMGLPSGQAVAEEMNKTVSITALTEDQLWSDGFSQWHGQPAPLWFYVLREAEVLENGLKLGPVASRIVAEVFLGLLQSDPESFIQKKPDWKPVAVGRLNPDQFTLVDLLKIADVPVT